MAVPDKDALIGPTVTEAQFKTNLGAIVDFIKPIESQSPNYATTALLTASRPVKNQSYAKALDTGKVWYWNKPAGSPEGNYWVDTGLSDYDQAKHLYEHKRYVSTSSFKAGSDSEGVHVDTNKIFKSDSISVIRGSSVRISRDLYQTFYGGVQFSKDGVHFKSPRFFAEKL